MQGQLPLPDDTEGVDTVYHVSRGNLREMRTRGFYKLYDSSAWEEVPYKAKRVESDA